MIAAHHTNKLSSEDQELIAQYKHRILEAEEFYNARDLPKLKTWESVQREDTLALPSKSPINRLNAVIFNTTDRLQFGNPEERIEEKKAMGRIFVPTMEELEAKIRGEVRVVTAKSEMSRRKKSCSPVKQLCPKIVDNENTKREIEDQQISKGRRQSAVVEVELPREMLEDRKNMTEIYQEKDLERKKSKRVMTQKSGKKGKATGSAYKENARKKIVPVKSIKKGKDAPVKEVKEKTVKSKTLGQRRPSTAKKGTSEKLWEIIRKHAKKCISFATELEREGFL